MAGGVKAERHLGVFIYAHVFFILHYSICGELTTGREQKLINEIGFVLIESVAGFGAHGVLAPAERDEPVPADSDLCNSSRRESGLAAAKSLLNETVFLLRR